jgi:hypothetical protein
MSECNNGLIRLLKQYTREEKEETKVIWDYLFFFERTYGTIYSSPFPFSFEIVMENLEIPFYNVDIKSQLACCEQNDLRFDVHAEEENKTTLLKRNREKSLKSSYLKYALFISLELLHIVTIHTHFVLRNAGCLIISYRIKP